MTSLFIAKARTKDTDGYIENIIGFTDQPMELTWGEWRIPQADNDDLFRPTPSFA